MDKIPPKPQHRFCSYHSSSEMPTGRSPVQLFHTFAQLYWVPMGVPFEPLGTWQVHIRSTWKNSGFSPFTFLVIQSYLCSSDWSAQRKILSLLDFFYNMKKSALSVHRRSVYVLYNGDGQVGIWLFAICPAAAIFWTNKKMDTQAYNDSTECIPVAKIFTNFAITPETLSDKWK